MAEDNDRDSAPAVWWKKPRIQTILKLVGAGITGGYLALRVSRPRQSYDEFLQVYDTLGVEFGNQLRGTLIQSLLAVLPDESRAEFEALLDRPATFLEMLRFFQKTLPEFEAALIRGLRRFYLLREGGLLASTARRKLARCDEETYQVALDELYHDLERSFAHALAANLPEGDPRTELQLISEFSLAARLEKVRLEMPHLENSSLSAVIFDALSSFHDEVSAPAGT